MTANVFVNNIEFLLAIVALLALFYGPWQSFVMEVLRQNMFNMRDALFLTAADGKISFESSEYKIVRERFNMMIRYAHTANWAHILAFIICKPKNIKQFNINEIASRIKDQEIARMVVDCYQRAMLYTALAIVARSLFLLSTNTICAPIVIVSFMLNSKKINESVGRAINADVEIEQGRKLAVA